MKRKMILSWFRKTTFMLCGIRNKPNKPKQPFRKVKERKKRVKTYRRRVYKLTNTEQTRKLLGLAVGGWAK